MPKSKRGRGKHLPPSQRNRAPAPVPVSQPQGAPQPAARAEAKPPAAAARPALTRDAALQYPPVTSELRNILIISAVMLTLLFVLARLLA